MLACAWEGAGDGEGTGGSKGPLSAQAEFLSSTFSDRSSLKKQGGELSIDLMWACTLVSVCMHLFLRINAQVKSSILFPSFLFNRQSLP